MLEKLGGTGQRAPRLTRPEFSPRIIPAWRETRGSEKVSLYRSGGKTIHAPHMGILVRFALTSQARTNRLNGFVEQHPEFRIGTGSGRFKNGQAVSSTHAAEQTHG